MKQVGRVLALLAAAGGLLALTMLLCGRHTRRKKACYVTLFRHES